MHARTKDPDRSPGAHAAAKSIRLDDATMILEVNSTDGDAGLQVFLDGEPWSEMAVFAPDGRKILAIDATGQLNRFGLSQRAARSPAGRPRAYTRP
jgi:hypothetical protein